LSNWKDDGEYYTQKGRIHHKNGGKYRISIKKDTNIVLKSKLRNHTLNKTPKGLRKLNILCKCGNMMEKREKYLGVIIDIKIFSCICGNSIEVMD